MSDFIGLFRTFIYRDVAFILGGSIVICSIAYTLRIWIDVQSLRELPSAFYVLFGGMAYIIGYAVQDMGAILGITRTGHHFVPRGLSRLLYRGFTNHPWNVAPRPHEEAIQFEIHLLRLDIPPETLENLERIVSLQVSCMCVGGCSFLSGLVLLVYWVCNRSAIAATGVLLIAAMLFLLGLSLIGLGGVKAMQQMQFLEAIRLENYPMRKPASRSAED